MPVVDIFSRRKKQQDGEFPDVYQYTTIPTKLKVQIVHIWTDALGTDQYGPERNVYEQVNKILCREYGVFRLTKHADPYQSIANYFLDNDTRIENALDIVELLFGGIDTVVREHWEFQDKPLQPDDAIHELNLRFKEHGVGYQYESGRIVRIDSQLIHAEVVKPVLRLLSEPIYKTVNDEFMEAHKYYRNRDFTGCLNECLKAFESTMKVICTKRAWEFNKNATSSKLIQICFENELIPNFLQSQFTSLRSMLQSGVPTVRNRLSGHGGGTTSVTVPEYIASYVLHLTATNILLLIEAENALP